MILIFMSPSKEAETRFTNSHGEKENVRKWNPAVATPSMLEKLVDHQNDSDIYEHLPKMEKPGSQIQEEKGQKIKSCGCNAIHFGEVGGSPKGFWYLWTPSQDGGIAELQLDMISSKIENLKENRKSSWLRYVAKFSYFFPK